MLVMIIGSLRGGDRTWHSLQRNMLRPNNADLALLVAPGAKRTYLHRIATHVWDSHEFSDWSLALDGIAGELGLNQTSWRKFVTPSVRLCCKKDRSCCMRPEFLGPIHWSATVNLVMRWQLKKRLLADELTSRYERFVITRSDQFYACPLTSASLDAQYVWIPGGEDYYGVTDRFVLCSRADVLGCLSIIDGFLQKPWAYDPTANPERYFKYRLIEQGLWSRVRRFPRQMFTATAPGDQTRGFADVSKMPDPTWGVHFKYEREYVRAKWGCGMCAEGSRTPFCCGHIGNAWVRELADQTGIRTQTWDERGQCQMLRWVYVLAAVAAASGAGVLVVVVRRTTAYLSYGPR